MSSSSKRLAMVVAAGHHATATASDSNNQQLPLKSPANRTAHVNLILASFFLGSVVIVSCMCICMNYCTKTKLRRRSGSAQGKILRIPPDSPNLDSSIYTLQGECPHRLQYCESLEPPPYRRPATPGPPPAYESIVSENSLYRKFGETDEYSDEGEKLAENDDVKYYVMTEETKQNEPMSHLNKLRFCKFHGNCSLYTEDETQHNETNEISKATNDISAELTSENNKESNRNDDIASCEGIQLSIDEDRWNREPETTSGNTINIMENLRKEKDEESCCRRYNNNWKNIQNNTNHNEKNSTKLAEVPILQVLLPLENHDPRNSSNSEDTNKRHEETEYLAVNKENDKAGDQVLPSYEDALVMASKKMDD